MNTLSDPIVVAAVVSAITSIITVLIIKPIIDKKYLVYRLEKEHQYDQRRQIKEIIAKFKVQIVNNAESLHHRVRAIVKCEDEDPKRVYWEKLSSSDNYEEYFYISTIHRFISFFNSLITLKNSTIFLDTTVADKKDLELIKFIQVFPQIFCGNHLFIGSETEITQINIEQDRFKTDNFLSTCAAFNPEVHTLEEFEKNYSPKYLQDFEIIHNFFLDINPNEERLRWDVLHLFWFALAAFLNTYGYDYQQVTNDRIIKVIKRSNRPRLLYGFFKLIRDNKLDKQHSIKKIIKTLSKEYRFKFV